MLNDPQILIMDEPTAGLDPNERIRFRNLISELGKERLVLLSTHIVSDVEYIADEILLMKSGKIEWAGTFQELAEKLPVKVWSCNINSQDLDKYLKNYKVVSVKPKAYETILRLLHDSQPCLTARKEEMTLEDIYFYYFGEQVGDQDAIL